MAWGIAPFEFVSFSGNESHFMGVQVGMHLVLSHVASTPALRCNSLEVSCASSTSLFFAA